MAGLDTKGEPNGMVNQHQGLELTSTPTQPLGLEIVEAPKSPGPAQVPRPAQGLEPSSGPGGPDVALELRLEPTQDPEQTQGPEPTEPAQGLGPTPLRSPTPGPGGSRTPGPESDMAPGVDPTMTPAHAPASAPASMPASGSPPTLNLPLQDLFEDNRRPEFFHKCVPLNKASMEGNWQAAETILGDQDSRRHLVRCSITDNHETMLHVAVSSESPIFVQNLVDIMQPADLGLQNLNGDTALCLAAITGNTNIARILVDQNPDLLTLRNTQNVIPLYLAALYGKGDMVTYLYDEMNHREWTEKNKRWVYLKCVETDLFDIALRIFHDHTELAKLETEGVLCILARKPYAFNETKQHSIQRIVSSGRGLLQSNENKAIKLLREILTSIEGKPKREIDAIFRGPMTLTNRQQRTWPSRVLFVAAELGNTRFIVELIKKYPDLIWKKNDHNQSIFHTAVSHRHESIYNLLYEIGSMKNSVVVLKDSGENNMLHLVGKMIDENRFQDVSGAAFLLQRELLWYKEVESMIPPSYRERKNESGLTPHELFTNTHKDLVSKGEKWMRGTASKCMLVATLIATIVFGVAYTIPGGYDQKLGLPIFRHNVPFLVFVVFDAISLILSSTSILVFLSILTSRYAQDDFIKSLPEKLMVGLSMLFISILTMMIAFSVSFYVLYRHKFIIVAGSISLLALIPIFSYARLQYPLLKDVIRSTYASRYLFKPKKQILYYRNPSV